MSKKVIATFATYPARIEAAYLVLKNILTQQTRKPDLVILNVYEGHFPGRKLPDKFNEFIKRKDFEIHWYESDMRSYRKFLYTFKKYPNDIVITLDDDIHYPKRLIEHLLEGHEKWPDAIIASAVFMMTFNDNGVPLPRWNWLWEETKFSKNFPSKWLYFGSGSGTLFIPKQIMTKKFPLLDEEKIKREAPTNDEAWLNVARIINNVKVVLYSPLYTVDDKVIENTAHLGLHRTLNNTPEEFELHNTLLERYGIKNNEMEPYTKYLINDNNKKDKRITMLETANQRLTTEQELFKKEISHWKNAYEDIVNSKSFRFGKVALAPFRAVRHFFEKRIRNT